MSRHLKSPGSIRQGRRVFLTNASLMVLSAALPKVNQASIIRSPERNLEFFNLHTNESLRCCYWKQGAYDVGALTQINHILRDHRAEVSMKMDPELLDLLHLLHRTTRSNAPYHIVSGYRSPKTNASLRKSSNGVAKRSLHMQGKAIDVRLPDVKLSQLRDVAISLGAGGVGYYAKSNFLHIDTGRPRSW